MSAQENVVKGFCCCSLGQVSCEALKPGLSRISLSIGGQCVAGRTHPQSIDSTLPEIIQMNC